MAQFAKEQGIHIATLYSWRQAYRLQGEIATASKMEPKGWSAVDRKMMVLEIADLNATVA